MPDGPSEPEPWRALHVQLFALAGSLRLSIESLPGTLVFSLAFLIPFAHTYMLNIPLELFYIFQSLLGTHLH